MDNMKITSKRPRALCEGYCFEAFPDGNGLHVGDNISHFQPMAKSASIFRTKQTDVPVIKDTNLASDENNICRGAVTARGAGE